MNERGATPLCPRCLKFIEPGDDTAKVNGVWHHATCAEDVAMEQMEAATLQENEA